MKAIFRDRSDAGRIVSERAAQVVSDPGALVLALPRGGVPVGFEVARRLIAELDICIVRKLGLPGQEELAIGAIASGGIRVLNRDLVEELRLPLALIDEITAHEQRELSRREDLYRQGRPALNVRNRTIVLVDDGLATGASMKAASEALRVQRPKRIIAAVPVAAQEACEDLAEYVDEVICALVPKSLIAIGNWYEDFSQTTDEEVRRLLQMAARNYVGGVSAESRE